MGALDELVLSLCGLIEAEGRLLRENAFALTRRCAIMILGLLFGAAALACFVAACYAAMLLIMPRPAAIALAGALCAIVSGALLWSVREKCDKNTRIKEERGQAEEAADRKGAPEPALDTSEGEQETQSPKEQNKPERQL